jgi:phosphoesterase RecJ-like protein
VLYNALHEQDSLARLQLVGRILARTKTLLDGKLVHTAALQEDFAATGAHPQDTEDVINMTLGIAGTQVAVILVEQAKGGFKISFRSRAPHVGANKLAEQFGGGGHKAAAGAFINEPYEAAKEKVLAATIAAMNAA